MYRILGVDGREYGPVSADQLRRWIAENRANAETRARAENAAVWTPLAHVPEFSGLFFTARISLPPNFPARATNSFAVTGLVFGILSLTGVFCCLGFPANILGLVFSVIGLSQIKNNPGLYEGRGLAIAGLILSIFGILLTFGMLSLWMAATIFSQPNSPFHGF